MDTSLLACKGRCMDVELACGPHEKTSSYSQNGRVGKVS